MDSNVMEALLVKISRGDLEALEGLYRAYHHAVYSYSLLLLRDQALAEDNAQDVFLRIWSKASAYQSGRNAKAWMMGITRHSALDLLRKSARETGLDDLPEEDLAEDDPAELRIVENLDIRHALRTLPAKDRQIVLLKAVAGLPSKDVGQLLGMASSTVHWRYQRALSRLIHLI
jgi:RNA polymerase sigma-70 factor, ECF subfamily